MFEMCNKPPGTCTEPTHYHKKYTTQRVRTDAELIRESEVKSEQEVEGDRDARVQIELDNEEATRDAMERATIDYAAPAASLLSYMPRAAMMAQPGPQVGPAPPGPPPGPPGPPPAPVPLAAQAPPPPPPPQPQQVPAPQNVGLPARQRTLLDHYETMYSYAYGIFMVADMGDIKSVARSRSKIYSYVAINNLSHNRLAVHQVDAIVEDAYANALSQRRSSAMRRVACEVTPIRKLFDMICSAATFAPVVPPLVSHNPTTELKALEAARPRSLYTSKRDIASFWTLLCPIAWANAYWEECVKSVFGVLGGVYFGVLESMLYGDSPVVRAVLHAGFVYFPTYLCGTAAFSLLPRFASTWVTANPVKVSTALHTVWNLFAFEGRLEAAWGATASRFPVLSWFTTAKQRGYDVVNSLCTETELMKPVETHEKYEFKFNVPVCEETFGARALFRVEGCTPSVNRLCTHNYKRGVDGRVGKRLPQDSDPALRIIIQRRWAQAHRTMRHLATVMSDNHGCVFPVDYEEWCRSLSSPKKTEFYLKFFDEPTDWTGQITKAFGKVEKAIKIDHLNLLVPHSDMRIIQPAIPDIVANCGPWMRGLVSGMKSWAPRIDYEGYSLADIAKGRQIIYTSGMTVEEVGDALHRASLTIPDCKIVEGDHSRFDLHCRRPSFRALDSFYDRTLPEFVTPFLKRNGVRGTCTDGSKYSTREDMMESGYPDTSAGDTTINTCAVVTILRPGSEFILVLTSDDFVLFLGPELYERIGGVEGLRHQFSTFGMETALEEHDSLDTVSFCSSHLRRAQDGPRETRVLFPFVGRLIGKMGWDSKQRTETDERVWAGSIKSCLTSYGVYDPLILGVAQMIDEEDNTAMVDEMFAYKARPKGTFTPDDLYCEEYYADRGLLTPSIMGCVKPREEGKTLVYDSDAMLDLVEFIS